MLHPAYTLEYVESQLTKYKERYSNHWRNHIYWAKKMIKSSVIDPPATLLDLGCSIGTYALEFALEGYNTIGLDLDSKALLVAQKLAKDEDCAPEWICADACNFTLSEPVGNVLVFHMIVDNWLYSIINTHSSIEGQKI